ncbi:hypothetical protein FJTKL_02482 [Diaporthe vaccinii]|uniref:non-specific serine/threonine protein kinase n=1 Tax=Diaporthe vaccinii TaxID=105482 RepID=A0ABR4DY99_9PEZI
MAPITQERHGYRIEKKLDDNIYVVRRESDNEQFLGTKWDASTVDPAFSDLLERGTKGALGSLLNHPNLINYADTVADNVVCGRGTTTTTVSAQRMILWDFCDAGTLQNLLKQHPVVPKTAAPDSQVVTQFLPEGLCWHVLLSVLRALTWLHEGHRDDTRIEAPSGRRRQHDWFSDPDWLPILHRDIRPDNIFFQHPKGTETYGLCKLGNYGQCAVSGHVNSNFVGQVVSATRGDESLNTLRAHLYTQDLSNVNENQRPYTKATELFQLGRIVYQMMSTRPVPDPEDNDERALDPQGDINPLLYSDGLKNTVRRLLSSYRGTCNSAYDLTSAVYSGARGAYLGWKAGTDDGKLHRDLVDDGWRRQVNADERIRRDEELLAAQRQLSSHRWTMEHLEPQPREAVPAVHPPPFPAVPYGQK